MADLRAGIIRLHEQGQKPREIARLLDVPPRTVYDAIKRFEETGSNKDRPRSGRPGNPTISGDWPPNSPDLTVMDYFVWPYLQSKVCSNGGHFDE